MLLRVKIIEAKGLPNMDIIGQIDVLVVVVKDKDTLSADDPIGKYQFSLASLTLNKEKDEWVELQTMCKHKNAGSLRVSLLLTKTI